ncbi:phosphoribosylformylglycinamidine synthase subunit PurL [Candidatus Kaiserbacteria bacterium CG10_big_fil_rev_8_21_14_0_10_51_14]|uniref:Phosphoribosylformylglycinamidine synthase subunit PurL n=1 Tax=Candidatus Kaiserbacteria bacterium CG10_big_fil_rev_8_21_14_0_10_51_14 TaxID=1974610 RepID=A0A2H0UC52_9BACT|nr:MAG: phosphoribosylformylglycinamidine synthase subunit PurL [Candidatus Kaiserbacteria bacterium CG10_big_fil_rev_8_21_14_0_10_51_14]
MATRILIFSKIPDARAHSYLHTLRARFPESGLKAASLIQVYTIDAKLSDTEVVAAADRLTNPVTETYSIGDVRSLHPFAIEIGFLPGVTDNVGKTARETIEDAIGREFAGEENVYSSRILFLDGRPTLVDLQDIANELHNPLIERVTICVEPQKIPLVVPRVSLHETVRSDEVDLAVNDEELIKIGKEGIQNPDDTRRGPLSLSLRALKTVRDHFQKLGRNPTDVELESLAQTWSEHCKHTIFADPMDEIKDGIYRHYIKGATEKIRKQKGKKDFCVSVFKDNSGAITFDTEYLVTHKVETHNAPSALDPFGGSVTAIVGVNRDCLGFGLGAKPIANTYGFFVANPEDKTKLFRDPSTALRAGKERQPLLPARRILEGVIHGINAGGNQSGIPTPLGCVAVDPSFRGKPLVFGGTVGLIPRKNGKVKLYEKKAKAGDYIVMIGGRVGLDGIHGATFSSESLSAGSPATAVQIGDPITQKKFSDALIREARDSGLYSSITDDGAGGLSGSVGEMAKESGGCDVDLDSVPLKYPGLAAWQIWVSESQERMTLAVPQKNWAALKKIFDRHDVEATKIGTFTNSGRCIVRAKGKVVMDMKLAFLHDGRPIEKQKTKNPKRTFSEVPKSVQDKDLGKTILEILGRPNIGSLSFISQQYDHEVQGTSVTKPLQGRGRVNADAAVLKPVPDSPRGTVLSHGYCPWYSQIDTYAMAAASIDTAIRNAICAGASRDYLAILDNFCWSSSEKPERLWELKQAAKACYDTAVAYGTPFISGKDSMFNDFRGFDARGKSVHIAALPTLLISALGIIPDVEKAMTLDFKRVGDLVYLLGETHDELGGSEYYALLNQVGKNVPKVDAKKNAKAYDALSKAIQNNLVASAISVGRGGLAAALAKSAIGGKLGAEINLRKIPGKAKEADAILFSESQGRMLVTVRRGAQKEFEKNFKGIAFTHIGEVVQEPSLAVTLPRTKVDVSLSALTESYRSFFKHW